MTVKPKRRPIELALSFFGIVFAACFVVSLVSFLAGWTVVPLDVVWTVWGLSVVGMGACIFFDANQMSAKTQRDRPEKQFMSQPLGVRLFGLAFMFGGVLMIATPGMAPWM